MATFYQKKSDIPGWWRDASDHWWQGAGWYEGGLDESQGAYPSQVAAPAPSTATTPTELAQTMDWSQTSQNRQTPLTYQALKDAGMWDLSDPNSQTWQWLNEQYGSGAGLGERPPEEMLGRALFDLRVPQSEYATAFQGLGPEFMQQLGGEVSRVQKIREESAKNQDWTEKYLEPMVNPITLGALAFGYLPGIAEAGSIGSGSVLSGEAAANTGGGMWDWLDSLLGETGEFGIDPSMLESGFNSGATIGPAGDAFMPGLEWGNVPGDAFMPGRLGEVPGFQPGFGPPSPLGPTTGGFLPEFTHNTAGLLDFLDPIKRFGSNVFKTLTGGDNASGGGTSAGRNVLNTILGDPLQAAFNATPFLLALTEANRQGDDLDDVIGKINGEAYSKSVLNPYDMDTGLGRTSMMEDQQRRGVRGSSFGDQSLGSYDYMRSLGRGDLFNRANLASAQLEGNLINTRNTNRNLLLGAGLNASGRMFQPQQQDPFGLRALFGG